MTAIDKYLDLFNSISIEKFIVLLLPFLIVISFMRILIREGKTIGDIIFDPIPVSHKIAVIGLPGTGKTTLITAIFELILKGEAIADARLHGLNTIAMVNRYVANLNSGQKIAPTREKDTFVFRFSYIKRKFFMRRSYDIEIADFPGELSDQISVENSSPDIPGDVDADSMSSMSPDFEMALFNREFFTWIASSREYLFVIDLSSIYSGPDVRRSIAELAARIRTSWQVIEDATSERGVGRLKNKSVSLVFTKLDSLAPIYKSDIDLSDLLTKSEPTEEQHANDAQMNVQRLKNEILDTGKKSDLVSMRKEDHERLQRIILRNDYIFRDIVSFFSSRSSHFTVLYSSMTLMDAKGGRFGIRKVFDACLP